MSKTTGKWVVTHDCPRHWYLLWFPEGLAYRIVRTVERTVLGFVWRGTEVYRGQVDAGNATEICAVLNGDTKRRAVCNDCCSALTPGSAFAATGTLTYSPCPTCLARAREEGKAEARGKRKVAEGNGTLSELAAAALGNDTTTNATITLKSYPVTPTDRRTGADRRKANDPLRGLAERMCDTGEYHYHLRYGSPGFEGKKEDCPLCRKANRPPAKRRGRGK